MAKPDPETSALKEQLADAVAQIDSLQAGVADAEARAATGRERLSALQSELEATREENQRLASGLRESAIKYRDARLAASPEIPSDLVTAEEMGEIEGQLAAAERVVGEMREKMERERRRETPAVPAGAPVRRAPDFSGLPPAEKIRVGLQESSRREGE